MSNFGISYDACSPNMAMSRNPKKQISKKIYLFLILHLILDKAAKFLVEKLSASEVISQKPHWRVENTPPPVLLGLNKKKVDTVNFPTLTYKRSCFRRAVSYVDN